MKDDRLLALLAPVAARAELEVESVDVTPVGKRRVVRVVVDGDGPTGTGPTLDEIAEATKAISAYLDETDVMGSAAYTLEVTSRGVDRPLTRAQHFRRNRGRLVAVTRPDQPPLIGRIVSASEEEVVLLVEDRGEEHRLPLAGIGKAVVQIELNRRAETEED